jgi:hypothetical protein
VRVIAQSSIRVFEWHKISRTGGPLSRHTRHRNVNAGQVVAAESAYFVGNSDASGFTGRLPAGAMSRSDRRAARGSGGRWH